jgi:hypothetical protein
MDIEGTSYQTYIERYIEEIEMIEASKAVRD